MKSKMPSVLTNLAKSEWSFTVGRKSATPASAVVNFRTDTCRVALVSAAAHQLSSSNSWRASKRKARSNPQVPSSKSLGKTVASSFLEWTHLQKKTMRSGSKSMVPTTAMPSKSTPSWIMPSIKWSLKRHLKQWHRWRKHFHPHPQLCSKNGRVKTPTGTISVWQLVEVEVTKTISPRVGAYPSKTT